MLQEKPLALKREHPALQNIKFPYLTFFYFVGNFCPQDPDSESGSIHVTESGYNPDPDPKH